MQYAFVIISIHYHVFAEIAFQKPILILTYCSLAMQ